MIVLLLVLESNGDTVPLPVQMLEPMLAAKLIRECACGHVHPDYEAFDNDADKWIEELDRVLATLNN